MRYDRQNLHRWIGVAIYALLSALWVYWVLDQQLLFGNDVAQWVAIVVVAAAHVAVGFGLWRWWAVLLPLIMVAMAVPLGYPSDMRGEPLPLWFGAALTAPFEAAFIAAGIGLRMLAARRPGPRAQIARSVIQG